VLGNEVGDILFVEYSRR